jgi:arginine-tRNA-protein transferase
MTIGHRKPELYLSMPHACSYLEGRQSTIVFVDPRHALLPEEYGAFVREGFRRSGDLVYRPYCKDCAACVPVRIPVADFAPTRSQRRVLARNRGMEVRERPAAFDAAHFELYRRYIGGRHAGSSMDDADPDRYRSFLLSRHANTRFIEFRSGPDSMLACVAVTDILTDGVSAVYTFFDPANSRRGLGVNAILWQVEYARRLKLPYVYLGYWIAESPKMTYKSKFRPLEALLGGQWTRLPGSSG